MDAPRILDGLNPEQRGAVEAVRGPVCIVAGAGSGKTTTITRRIANQVASGTFAASEILAVTFTDKAAGEMRSRLAALGVEGVEARTFHSAAFAMLRGLAPEPPASVLPSKVITLRQIANSLPKPFRFRPAADLATEIERAKNRRIGPAEYRRSLDGHNPPIPPDLMERVYREYERRKSERGLVDFEDMLERAVRLLEEDASAQERFQSRFRAFTVDEYQDVNLLQQRLLELWLGERDDLCVVGDDYQSIYAFTGATPSYLLTMRGRLFKLEANYRSSPQVLELANRLVPGLGGAEKTLRAVRPDGPEPIARAFGAREDETAFLVEQLLALRRDGVAYEQMAVLYRTNARSEEYEEALAAAGIPYRVRAGAFLERAAARRLLPVLRRSSSIDVGAEVRRLAEDQGLLSEPAEGLGESELTRQQDLARLVRLAEELDDGRRTVAEFVTVLEQRLADGGEEGVNLLTYHRAKGLEFEAVFLPRLERNELPVRQAKTDGAVAEERRLLYVGMTRAKRHLFLTRAARPSPFLAELGIDDGPARSPKPDEAELPPAYRALKEWRLTRARRDGVPAYVVFHDRTLAEIATRRPGSAAELAGVSGVGPAKLERYGSEVLATLAEAS
ncbi:MAG: ATP-dependent DNA helicase UvrD2 [Actinobacteria bacterium]|nr:ATP-dependent DNA helicase UvrD2 [Actinomycetota bacterium]